MPLRISLPTYRRIVLSKSDPTGDTYVDVREVRQKEQERRASELASESRIWRQSGEEIEYRKDISLEDVVRAEVYLALAGCNIEREDGQPLFRFKDGHLDMDIAEFSAAWRYLPVEVAVEIHNAILEMNPVWVVV